MPRVSRDEVRGTALPPPPRAGRWRAWRRPPAEPEEAVWRAGWLWAYAGRYDHAWRWWATLTADRWAARRQAAYAQTLRDLGLHDLAAQHTAAGLACAREVAEELWLRTGAVADALGQGDLAAAEAAFAAAADRIVAVPSTPEGDLLRVRLGWVAAELSLAGVPVAGGVLLPTRGRWGRVDRPACYRRLGTYELAKGLLFRGVLDRDPRTLAVARWLAPPGLRWAVELARADLGVPGALPAAQRAWQRIQPPPEHAARVAATPTARRLAGAPARS